MLQANVCVLCMPPSFPAVPQYLGHTSVVPQPLAEPDKQLSRIRLFVQPIEVEQNAFTPIHVRFVVTDKSLIE